MHDFDGGSKASFYYMSRDCFSLSKHLKKSLHMHVLKHLSSIII